MEEKLTKEQVLHVANLARLALTDKEIEKYQYQLKDILTEIDRINKVDIKEESVMISPCNNNNQFREDCIGNTLPFDELIKNVNKFDGNYIEVPGVINE